MEICKAVGENVRRVRKTEKLTLPQAAEKSGVSKSMLGQIERGDVNPTVTVLFKIARGLCVPLERLLEIREETAQLFPALSNPAVYRDSSKVVLHSVYPYEKTTRCETRRMDIFISGCYHSEPRQPGSTIYVTLLSGTMQVESGGETYLLEEWDGLKFPADGGYVYTNMSNHTVRILEQIYAGGESE